MGSASKPLGELAGTGERELLDETTRKLELAVERRGEVERRLNNVANVVSAFEKRCSEHGLDERELRRMLDDKSSAEIQRTELDADLAEVCSEIALEESRQKELIALMAEEEERNLKSSVWMVSSLGVPGAQRLKVLNPAGAAQVSPTAGAIADKETVPFKVGGGAGEGDESSGDEVNIDEELEGDDDDDDEEVVPLNNPEGVCVSVKGTLYVTDTVRSCVRSITQRGKVHRFAGRGTAGHADGVVDDAMFRHPRGLCLLGAETEEVTIAVCDTENHCIRLITGGDVTTIAGVPCSKGHCDGNASEAKFNAPWALCSVDEGRCLLVCDGYNHCIRKISGMGSEEITVSTVFGRPGQAGSGVGELNFPWSICAWNRSILVGDKLNQRLLMIDMETQSDVIALSDSWQEGFQFSPRGLATVGSAIYMSHSWQSQIWRLDKDPEGKLCRLDRIAGTGLPNHRDGKGELCEFFCPSGLALDTAGAIYVADYSNHCVRKCRELRSEEVKQKLAKLVRDINNRWVVASFIKWRNSVEVQEALEPLSVVLAMAMGFHGRLGKESALLPLTYVEVGSLVLRKMIHFVAKRLGWRLVRTRDELTREADAMDEVDPAEGDVNNMNNHLQEAKSAFLLYDKDGGGTIDAGELCEALAAADMEVTPDEVKEMINDFGSSEISFSQFCQMLGVEIPTQYPPKDADSWDTMQGYPDA